MDEVKAYIGVQGLDDPACHATRGCLPRTVVIFVAVEIFPIFILFTLATVFV
ncbi:hypothetical protein LDL57_15660 (plasmid) [Arsenophonus apicola]|nr:hypothetical protein LDL57_15660 [Arsenophonus apicola]